MNMSYAGTRIMRAVGEEIRFEMYKAEDGPENFSKHEKYAICTWRTPYH